MNPSRLTTPHTGHSLHAMAKSQMCQPRHIGIVMDGNSRYAEKKSDQISSTSGRFAGHVEGVKALKRVLNACQIRGIEALSVFAFSTENWGRSTEEVEFLLNLFENSLRKESDELVSRDVRVKFIGERSRIPSTLLREIERVEDLTVVNQGMHLCVSMDYSGRSDIVNAAKTLAALVKEKKIDLGSIDEASFAATLSTSHLPPLDLIVRTSGEQRLSNFMLWEAAYAELVFVDQFWPAFTEHHLNEALAEFARRKRRFGTRPS